MATEKSKAQEYRDERKARIAESAKKNAKDMHKRNASKKIVKRVIAIVLAAAVALGAVSVVLNYYGVWDRMIMAGGSAEGDKFSLAEYEYYYWSTYNSLLNQVSSNYSTGTNYNFDPNLPPDKQTTMAEDEEGNPISWVQFLRLQALDQLELSSAIYAEAKKNGQDKITAADQQQIDEIVENWRVQAESMGADGTSPKYSLDAYLRLTFGEYMNESFLRKILEKNFIVENYTAYLGEQIEKGYSAEEITAKYEEDKSAYDMVDIRLYEFALETLTAEDGESDEALEKRQTEADAKTKKDAEAFLAAVKDDATFIAEAEKLNKEKDAEYDGDTSTKLTGVLKANAENISEDLSEWLFAESTKAGSKKLFEIKDATGKVNSYYVVYLIEGPHQVDTVSVRHILLSNTDATTGATLSDEELAQKKKDAEALLAEWKNGEKTEDSFAALATLNTEDTGSAENGGLYKGVCPGQMVPEFDAWIFDESRKPGDTEIVETDYGYHIMYFVDHTGKYYDVALRSSLGTTDLTAEVERISSSDAYALSYGPRRMEYAEDKMNKHIEEYLAKQSAQSSYSYY